MSGTRRVPTWHRRGAQFPDVGGPPSQQADTATKEKSPAITMPWLRAPIAYASMKLEGRNMSFSAYTTAVVLLFALAVDSRCQVMAQNTNDESKLSATMERLDLTIPLDLATPSGLRKSLEELTREPCDQTAIADLGKWLEKSGYRRDAANAHIRFSATCNGHPSSLRSAANLLLKISDYAAASEVASELIKLEPFDDNGYYLRALANDRAGRSKKAIDDYVTAIELFGAKNRISSVSYFAMARNYEKLGQICDAILPIEAWVGIDPGKHDTSQTRAIIADYTSRGNCADAASGKEDVFAVARHNNVVTLPATVNDVSGTFVLDTGATFVVLTTGFARKAQIDVDNDAHVRLTTLNGVIEAKRGRARSIRLRTLVAKDVQVVVQSNEKPLLGPGIDGVLGMSLLSRFNVAMDSKTIRIRRREGK